MSSANRDSLTTSFSICIPIISSFCVIALTRNSKTLLNKSRESEHTYIIPVFRGNGFSFSPISMMLTVSLSDTAFLMLSYIPSIPSFIRALSRNDVDFFEGFFYIY
jgi:hypothetical protein